MQAVGLALQGYTVNTFTNSNGLEHSAEVRDAGVILLPCDVTKEGAELVRRLLRATRCQIKEDLFRLRNGGGVLVRFIVRPHEKDMGEWAFRSR
jgi:hypothetical protein